MEQNNNTMLCEIVIKIIGVDLYKELYEKLGGRDFYISKTPLEKIYREERNRKIYELFLKNPDINKLSQDYNLSPKYITKIVKKLEKELNNEKDSSEKNAENVKDIKNTEDLKDDNCKKDAKNSKGSKGSNSKGSKGKKDNKSLKDEKDNNI